MAGPSRMGWIQRQQEKRLAEWGGHVPPGTILPIGVDEQSELYGAEILNSLSDAQGKHYASGVTRRYRWFGYDHDVCFSGAGNAEWVHTEEEAVQWDDDGSHMEQTCLAHDIFNDRTTWLNLHAMLDPMARDKRGDTSFRVYFLPEAIIAIREDASAHIKRLLASAPRSFRSRITDLIGVRRARAQETSRPKFVESLIAQSIDLHPSVEIELLPR